MADDAAQRVDDFPSSHCDDSVPSTQNQSDEVYYRDLPDALIVTNLDECIFDDVNCKVGTDSFIHFSP
jgi:hypothetical protein